MASNLPQHLAAGPSTADPTAADLQTLVTALESLLTLSQSQIRPRSPPEEHMNSLSLGNQTHPLAAGPTKSEKEILSSNPNPPSLPYVDGAIAGELDAEELHKAWEETESHVRRKLIEIHSKLKNGCIPWDEDESMLLEQDNNNPSEKIHHRKTSHHEQQNPEFGENNQEGGDHHMQDNDDDEAETDEGTVSDPSPSPHLTKAPVTLGSSSYTSTSYKSSASSVGPGRETAEVIVSQCVRILDIGHGFASETKALSAQLLAELAKTSNGRSLCLHHRTRLPSNPAGAAVNDQRRAEVPESVSVVEAVANVLGPECPLETSVQICRILANLCYDCEEGRQQILKCEGCLKKLVEISKGREERIKKYGEDPGQRLPAILPGFLLNFCNGTPEAIEAVGQLGFIDVVAETITQTKTNDAVFNNCLSFLNCLADESSAYSFLVQSQLFPIALCHILRHTTSPEVTEYALELIQAVCEQDNQTNSGEIGPRESRRITDDINQVSQPESITLGLAKSSLCSVMIELITGRWQHSLEFQELRTNGCNLLVLILSHDSSLRYMYSQKQSSFLDVFREWLSSEDAELETCAALAVGNFACNETHCTELVSNGTSVKLIQLLGTRQNCFEHLKLQHALLGALKNLVVAPSSRLILLQQGLLDPCLTLGTTMELGMVNQPIVYKLLATLRLSVDGHPEAACKIGSSAIIGRVVDWGANDAPPGVRAEATRLLAAILKHCQAKEIMKNIVDCGGLPHIVFMLHSNHVVMLNEAIVSLTIMASTLSSNTAKEELTRCDADQQLTKEGVDNKEPPTPLWSGHLLISSQLHTDAVINAVKNCLKNVDLPKEVKANAATLTIALLKVKKDEFKQMLEDMNFVSECLNEEALKMLPRECKRLFDVLTQN